MLGQCLVGLMGEGLFRITACVGLHYAAAIDAMVAIMRSLVKHMRAELVYTAVVSVVSSCNRCRLPTYFLSESWGKVKLAGCGVN